LPVVSMPTVVAEQMVLNKCAWCHPFALGCRIAVPGPACLSLRLSVIALVIVAGTRGVVMLQRAYVTAVVPVVA